MRATNLSAYTVSQCADVCTKLQPNCKGFNMYYQRVPKNDTKYNDLSCTVPPNSTTLMTCQILQRLFPAASRLNNTDTRVTASERDRRFERVRLVRRLSTAGQFIDSLHGPVPSPDTPAAFKNFNTFANKAYTATTPSGFRRVFVNQTAAAAYSSDGSDYSLRTSFVATTSPSAQPRAELRRVARVSNLLPAKAKGVRGQCRRSYCSLPSASYTHVICDLHASVISSSNFTDPTARSGYVRTASSTIMPAATDMSSSEEGSRTSVDLYSVVSSF